MITSTFSPGATLPPSNTVNGVNPAPLQRLVSTPYAAPSPQFTSCRNTVYLPSTRFPLSQASLTCPSSNHSTDGLRHHCSHSVAPSEVSEIAAATHADTAPHSMPTSSQEAAA